MKVICLVVHIIPIIPDCPNMVYSSFIIKIKRTKFVLAHTVNKSSVVGIKVPSSNCKINLQIENVYVVLELEEKKTPA